MIAVVNKAEKLDELVGSVEDLLAQLPDALDPRLAALRDKVDDGIFEAWTSISSDRLQAERARRRIMPLSLGAVIGLTVLVAISARSLLNRNR